MLLTDLEYSRLVAEGLVREVLPVIEDGNAKVTVQMAVQALRELIHRQTALPGILAMLVPQGIALVKEMETLLSRADIRIPVEQDDLHRLQSSESSFTQLAKRLDDGAKALLDLDTGSDARASITGWLRAVAEWESAYYSTFRDMPMVEVGKTEISGRMLTPAKLIAHLAERVPELGRVAIESFVNFPGGMSNETYMITLDTEKAGRQDLVGRKKALRPYFTFWANQARDEFQIVRILSDLGLPVARPLWLFEDMADVDGAYYLMERGKGAVAGNHAAAFGEGAKFPEELMLNLAAFLGRLHSIPLDAFAGYLGTGDTPARVGDTTEQLVRKNINFLSDYWRTSRRRPCPSEAYMIDWLRNNVPANPRPPVLVHADCFVHNFLIDEGNRITTVVDWESAHFGDPAEDLAYIRDQVGKSIDWSRFMEAYHAAGGPPVDEASFDYFKAFLNFRNSWGTNIAVTRVEDGFFDIRMATLGSTYFTGWMEENVKATADIAATQESERP